MTQGQVAERLGVKQPQVARWEADGYVSASLRRVSTVAAILGVDLSETPMPLAAETRTAYASTGTSTGSAARGLARLGVHPEALAAFARSHGIVRLELFGSVLSDDFGPASDVDVLVTYAPGRTPSLIGAVDYEAELSAIVRRPVDLVTRASVERGRDGARKRAVLDGAQVVYAAR